MPATPSARSVRPAPNRRPARRLVSTIVAVTLLIMCPGTASAQLIDFLDWLDRLSGPGPFKLDPPWIPRIAIPIACINEVSFFPDNDLDSIREVLRTATGQPTGRLTSGQQTAIDALKLERRITPEFLPRCLGVTGVAGAHLDLSRPLLQTTPPWGMLSTPAGDRPISRKRNLLGFEVSFANLASQENELPYPVDVTESEKRVKVFVFGAGARWFVTDSAFAAAGVNLHRFYSKSSLFEAFNRITTSFELGLKPNSPAVPEILRPFTFSVGIVSGLGDFEAADFGALGDWRDSDRVNPYVQLGYDIWWHGCWLNRCQ